MTNDPRPSQIELERLQARLAQRMSITHFAHTGVALIAALIFSSAAGKLFWDSAKVPYLGFLALAVALGLAAYAFVQYRRGRACLTVELEQFAQLQALRRELKLDDPASLLPHA